MAKVVTCKRKGCGKCLYCLKIMVLCECSEKDKIGEPKDVMYGWCRKCREKHPEDYKQLVGRNCTYCGGAIEDNYPPAGILLALVLFPIGESGPCWHENNNMGSGIVVCCMLKERQCVNCNKSYL